MKKYDENSEISFEVTKDCIHFNNIIDILFNGCNSELTVKYKKKKKIKIKRIYKKTKDKVEIYWKIIGINLGFYNTMIPEMEVIYNYYLREEKLERICGNTQK